MLTHVICELQRVWIAATVDRVAVGADHQPAEVPGVAGISHRDSRANANDRMRTDHEEFLLHVVIRGATLHEDFVIDRVFSRTRQRIT